MKKPILTARQNKRFQCLKCKYSCSRGGNLKRHNLMKHEMQRFQCLQCDSDHSSAEGLSSHVKSIHEGHMLECNFEPHSYMLTSRGGSSVFRNVVA